MTTPAKRAARRDVLVELAAVALELEQLDAGRDELAAKRDELIVAARQQEPRPSLRDVAEIGRVTHPWVRKLEARARAREATS